MNPMTAILITLLVAAPDDAKNNPTTPAEQYKALVKEFCQAASRDVAMKWNANTPSYYVIDHHGVIRHKWLGNTGPGAKAIDAAVEKLIHEAETKRRNGGK